MNQELFKIGVILKVTGVIVVIWGFMQGVAYLPEYVEGLGAMIALSTAFTPMVFGLLIYGFGEVIELLQELVGKGKLKAEKESSPISKVPFYAESEINEYYLKMNTIVEGIKPTSKSDIFSVEVGGKTEYIELTGFTPKVLTKEEADKLID